MVRKIIDAISSVLRTTIDEQNFQLGVRIVEVDKHLRRLELHSGTVSQVYVYRWPGDKMNRTWSQWTPVSF